MRVSAKVDYALRHDIAELSSLGHPRKPGE